MDICIFGDSVGKGVVLRPDSRRYKAVEMDLQGVLGRTDITISNYAVMGCTVSKALSIVKRRACELLKFNKIFLELGGNDCDFLWQEIAASPDTHHVPKTPLESFTRTYKQIIAEIREHGGNPIMLTLPPLDPVRYFAWVSQGMDKSKILHWLGDVEMIYRWQEMYNVAVMMLASKLAVPLIDIRSAFLRRSDYRELICADGIHPNAAGHELIYTTVADSYK